MTVAIGRVHGRSRGIEQGAARAANAARDLRLGVIQSTRSAAALGTQHVGFRDGEIVAMDLDVEVVLHGKLDRILQRQVHYTVRDE